MKKFLALIAGILLFAAMCVAQDPSATSGDQNSDQSVVAAAKASKAQVAAAAQKQADIRRLLALTGAASIATQTMDEMEKTIRPLIANSLPAGDYRDRLMDLFFEKFHEKRDPAQLVDLIVPIYDKYYSADEIKGLIAFYETPIGNKMITVLPKIMAESQAAGGQWGQELGRECMMEVLQEHPEMQRAIVDAKAKSGK
jgi:hypothetical protein